MFQSVHISLTRCLSCFRCLDWLPENTQITGSAKGLPRSLSGAVLHFCAYFWLAASGDGWALRSAIGTVGLFMLPLCVQCVCSHVKFPRCFKLQCWQHSVRQDSVHLVYALNAKCLYACGSVCVVCEGKKIDRRVFSDKVDSPM